MNAKTGKFGLTGQGIQYKKIFKRLLAAIGIVIIAVMWLSVGEKQDNELNKKFDYCQNNYALMAGQTYQTYMQNCMN